MKAMKFKIEYPENSKQIQEKLFEMGYEWASAGQVVKQLDSPCLYTSGRDITFSSDSKGTYVFFDQHRNEEHWLVNGEFVDASYWKQPTTAHGDTYLKTFCGIPYDGRGGNIGSGGGGKTYTFPYVDNAMVSVKEPPSKAEHERLRMLELLRAITAKVEAQEDVKEEWWHEVKELASAASLRKQFVKLDLEGME